MAKPIPPAPLRWHESFGAGAAGGGAGRGAPLAPLFLSMLAKGLWKIERHDDALGALGLGLALAEQQGQHFYDAELHRLRAEILLETVDSQQSRVESEKTAEECFQRAVEIARRQEARTFELRAATSLARLWERQGSPRASATPPAPCSRRCTPGSPKASTRAI